MANIEDEDGTGIEDESGAPIQDEGSTGYIGTKAGGITPTGAPTKHYDLNRTSEGAL